jgi:uncharacterized protein (TIRG00374 family)
MIIAGFIISIALVLVILSRIDWQLFLSTIQQLQPVWLFLCAIFIVFGVFIRSLRWNVITGFNFKNFWQFWDATNLGYLGNLIYPARAGEILRIVALKRFITISEGNAISSALIDRISDGIMLPLFIVILVEYFRSTVEIPVAVSLFALAFIIISILLFFFIVWGEGIGADTIKKISFVPGDWIEKISYWYTEAHGGAVKLKDPRVFFIVIFLSIFAFLTDSLAYYLLFNAFGWTLPFSAAVTVCLFIFAGSALPSTPGYFGIYQLACILALIPFGINNTASVAYSLIIQCISYAIFLIIGGWIIYSRGLSLRSMKTD